MENKYSINFYRNIKKLLEVSMKLVYNPKVNGINNIPSSPYILAGNHKSLLDIPLLISSIPSEIHFMAKKELFEYSLVKYIFMKMGAFPVDREKVDLNAIKEALSILKNNEVLGIFPEGTRNKTNDILLPFKGGISSIASKTKSLIVPFGIVGEYKRNSIELNIGEPINIREIEKKDQTKYLEDKVKKLILE